MTRTGVINRVAEGLVQIPTRHTLRVAIDGITGAGKTTFAAELAAAVHARGRNCIVVSLDGFHRPRADRYRQGRESPDGYYEDAYDFAALRDVLLDPLGPTGDGRYRTAVLDLHSDRPVAAAPQLADARLVVIVDGSFLQRPELSGSWDAVVFLRTSFEAARGSRVARDASLLGSQENARRLYDVRYHAAQHRYVEEVDPDAKAEIVIDHEDPRAPRIVRIAEDLFRVEPHLRRTRAFFAPRAAGWDERFPGDDAVFGEAITELGVGRGHVVVDLGCGTGRALPALQRAVGATGVVIGIDASPEMLRIARQKGRDRDIALVLADAARLPVGDARVDAVFAAGLLTHVPDPAALLRGLVRAAKPDCRLALFHPIGRRALARRHGRTLRSDELLERSVVSEVLHTSGWELESVEDGDRRYLALARKGAISRAIER